MSTAQLIKWIRKKLHDYECITLGDTCIKCLVKDYGGES